MDYYVRRGTSTWGDADYYVSGPYIRTDVWEFGDCEYYIRGNQIRRKSEYGEVVYTIDGNYIRKGGSYGDIVYNIDGNHIRSGSSRSGSIVYTFTRAAGSSSSYSSSDSGSSSSYSSSGSGSSSSSSGGCYIATAVYGSYDCPEVWTLRRYRDNNLQKSFFGRLFVKVYYAVSPTLVKWFGKTKAFNRFWRGRLDKMVNRLREKGYDDTPYED